MKLALPQLRQKNLATTGAIVAVSAYVCGLFNKQIVELLPRVCDFLGAATTCVLLFAYLLFMLAGATVFAGLFLAMTPLGGLALIFLLQPKQTKLIANYPSNRKAQNY